MQVGKQLLSKIPHDAVQKIQNRAQSNGESAFRFFTEHIKEHALYLLDEPENSLAADLQLQLSQFIADTALHALQSLKNFPLACCKFVIVYYENHVFCFCCTSPVLPNNLRPIL